MSDDRYCGNTEALVSLLYEEGDEGERRNFERHLASCDACAREVRGMREVRNGLAAWTPPETVLDFRIVREAAAAPVPIRRPWFSIPQMPAWAQFAAAVLVVGVAVGISGLEVRYDQQGLSVRAGWNKPAASAPASAQPAASNMQAAQAPAAGDAPWRAELAAFEQRMKEQYAHPASDASPTLVAAATGPRRALSDDEFMTRVRDLINASETKQQREMAVRISQVMRDMDTKHRADLARVVDNFGVLEGRTGVTAAQQREMLNYLVRVSQKQDK